MNNRTLALRLVLVGCLLLPAPLYLGVAAEAVSPPPKTSQVYVADPLDPSNASDRAAIADRHDTAVALSVHQVSEQYSAGEYRSPATTRRTLEAAMRTGEATTDDAGARADLREIARENAFVHDAYADDEQYYRLRVRDRGATVTATPVSTDRVANATLDQAPRYESLSAGERTTVDRIIRRSPDEGYRPRVNDPFVDRLPALVVKGDTAYSIVVYGHVDDFGPGFRGFIVGLGVAAIGVVLVLAGLGVYAWTWWREED